MAYIDFNPIRAGIASTPEASDYTSVQQRIQSILNTEAQTPAPQPPERNHTTKDKGSSSKALLHFDDSTDSTPSASL